MRAAVTAYGVFNVPDRLLGETDEGATLRQLTDRATLRVMRDMVVWIENNRTAVRG